MSEEKDPVLGEGVGPLLDFVEERVKPRVEVFTDPLGISPPVHAVIGRAADGGTSIDAIDFDRDAWRDRPRRRKGTLNVTTLESFIAMVNRQSGEQSVIFADDGKRPSLTAVLNFHEPSAEGEPAFCDDRVRYEFPLSDEWELWTGQDKVKMDQTTFAEFIENNLFDIGDPGSAGAIATSFAKEGGVELAGRQRLLGLSKGLSVRVEHRVSKSINLQSGEGRIEYSEEHKDDNGGPLIVPAAFHIFIPVFRGGARYSIPVRLRYRTSGGKVQWFFEIHRADLFILDAVNDGLAIVKNPGDPTAPVCPDCRAVIKTVADHRGECDWVRREIAAGRAGVPDVPPPGCGLAVYMGTPPA